MGGFITNSSTNLCGYRILNSSKNYKFIFKKSYLPRFTIITILGVIRLNLLTELSPLIRQQEVLKLGFQLPEFILNGLIFKIMSIVMLVILVINYFRATLFTDSLLKQLKYKKKNPEIFFETIFGLLKLQIPITNENYYLICTLLLNNDNLRNTIKNLKKDSNLETVSKEYKYADELINSALTDRGFLNYLCTQDKFVLIGILDIIKEEEAKECYQFIRKLSASLICKESFLDYEIDDSGDGNYRILIEDFYSNYFFYNNFTLFDVDFEQKDSELKVLEKLTNIMEVSIKDYFTKIDNQNRNRIV